MTPENRAPEAPNQAIGAPSQEAAQAAPQPVPDSRLEVPAVGSRLSIRDIRRQLTEEELRQTGVQKLLIEDFERAEKECLRLQEYEAKFHESDKRVGVLEEKLKVNLATDIISGVGIAGGASIMSLAPYFWDATTRKGAIALVVGFLFIVGSVIAQAVKVRK